MCLLERFTRVLTKHNLSSGQTRHIQTHVNWTSQPLHAYYIKETHKNNETNKKKIPYETKIFHTRIKIQLIESKSIIPYINSSRIGGKNNCCSCRRTRPWLQFNSYRAIKGLLTATIQVHWSEFFSLTTTYWKHDNKTFFYSSIVTHTTFITIRWNNYEKYHIMFI